MNRIFRMSGHLLKSIFYIPHIVLYLLSPNKDLIKEDCKVNMIHRHRRYNGLPSLFFMLQDDYFVRLFYYRIGKTSSFLSWYRPGDKTYMIESQTIMGGGNLLSFLRHDIKCTTNRKEFFTSPFTYVRQQR